MAGCDVSCVYLCDSFCDVNMLDFTAPNDAMINICFIGEDVEGDGGDLVCGTTPEFFWKDRGITLSGIGTGI